MRGLAFKSAWSNAGPARPAPGAHHSTSAELSRATPSFVTTTRATARRPSAGLKARSLIRWASTSPGQAGLSNALTSHSRSRPSPLNEAKRAPSGLNATPVSPVV